MWADPRSGRRRRSNVPYADVPESIVNYVRRSHRAVLLDDAGARPGDFVADDYRDETKPATTRRTLALEAD